MVAPMLADMFAKCYEYASKQSDSVRLCQTLCSALFIWVAQWILRREIRAPCHCSSECRSLIFRDERKKERCGMQPNYIWATSSQGHSKFKSATIWLELAKGFKLQQCQQRWAFTLLKCCWEWLYLLTISFLDPIGFYGYPRLRACREDQPVSPIQRVLSELPTSILITATGMLHFWRRIVESCCYIAQIHFDTS